MFNVYDFLKSVGEASNTKIIFPYDPSARWFDDYLLWQDYAFALDWYTPSDCGQLEYNVDVDPNKYMNALSVIKTFDWDTNDPEIGETILLGRAMRYFFSARRRLHNHFKENGYNKPYIVELNLATNKINFTPIVIDSAVSKGQRHVF